MSSDLSARVKAAFKEFYKYFPLKPIKSDTLYSEPLAAHAGQEREHAATTLACMLRALWRGKMHCTKLHTRFEGHARVFKDLEEIKTYVGERLNKYPSPLCPVHGGKLFMEPELRAARQLLALYEECEKQADELEAAMSKSAEAQRRRKEEARDREDAETKSVLLAMGEK